MNALLRPALALLCCSAAAAAVAAHHVPTSEGVLDVQEWMNAHPGPYYEMVSKCSCALDALAGEVKFDDYVEMSTAAKAASIGGERGNTIRDTEPLQAEIKRYRDL